MTEAQKQFKRFKLAESFCKEWIAELVSFMERNQIVNPGASGLVWQAQMLCAEDRFAEAHQKTKQAEWILKN